MFEKYTEKARRVVFFARYEASQFGSANIESEHILLAILREDPKLISNLLRQDDSIEAIRKEIESHKSENRERVPTSVEMPLSEECRRVLKYAAEEAEGLSHPHIDTIHILLGLLKEEDCLAAKILRNHGIESKNIHQKSEGEQPPKTQIDEFPVNVISAASPEQFSAMSFLIELFRDENSPAAEHLRKQGIDPAALRQWTPAQIAPRPYVPNIETALRIAEAVCLPIYGKEYIESQKPLHAELANTFWIVRGSPTDPNKEHELRVIMGKMDGRIILIGRQQESHLQE